MKLGYKWLFQQDNNPNYIYKKDLKLINCIYCTLWYIDCDWEPGLCQETNQLEKQSSTDSASESGQIFSQN